MVKVCCVWLIQCKLYRKNNINDAWERYSYCVYWEREQNTNSSESSQAVPFRPLVRRPSIAFGYDGEVMCSGLFECASEERFWAFGPNFVFRVLHRKEILIRLGEGGYFWSGILKLMLGSLLFSFLERMVVRIGKFKWHDALLIFSTIKATDRKEILF